MEKELKEFIKENNLSPFQNSSVRNTNKTIFKTREAKAIYDKVIDKISSNFQFKETENLWNLFNINTSKEEVTRRQEFFKKVYSENKGDNSFLKKIQNPKKWWKPKYDVIVVTENGDTFIKLKELNCPVKFINSERDVLDLNEYDLIQVLDCGDYSIILESLPQTVFLDSLDEAYLERYLEELSGWKDNLELIEQTELGTEIKKDIEELKPLLSLIENKEKKRITREIIDEIIENINEEVTSKIKTLNFSGEMLINILSKNLIPSEINQLIKDEIKKTGLPEEIFIEKIPLELDEKEFEDYVKKQNSNEFSGLAESIKRHSRTINQIPFKLREIEENIIYYDFISGISKFMKDMEAFPEITSEFSIEKSKNLMIHNPQPVNFNLTENFVCSILTGANSGGKTTLLEHILQLISLSYLGLPITGKANIPLFTEVYYFAKTKGSVSKGAFETLLSQMASINTGKQTLILADEIEAVTEPGVAGKIISATADYFINKGCFLIIATHLGQEIQKVLPLKARIDGIEAKGLDENFELIVDHNPVLGRLANSTPELIVEKLASVSNNEYFGHIHNYLKNPNNKL